MPSKKVIDDIKFEINRINKLLEQYESLILKIVKQEPDFIELNALAMLLHSFYNGLENIFKRIARKIDDKIPLGEKYHIDLLEQMSSLTENREIQVITESTSQELRKYLGFRHFLRHAYAFELNWELLKELILGINEIKEKLLEELNLFINKIMDRD